MPDDWVLFVKMNGVNRFEEIALIGKFFAAPDVPSRRVFGSWMPEAIYGKTTFRGNCKTRIDEKPCRHKRDPLPRTHRSLHSFDFSFFK